MPHRKLIHDASSMEGHKQEMRNQNQLDPTSRTIEQMQREISHLKELLLQRSDSMQTAIDTAHEDLVRVPTEVMKAIGGLKELLETKINYEAKLREQEFDHIDEKFTMNEKFRLELKADYKEALSAALNAAKEAVSEQNKSNVLAITKSEAATTKQMDSISEKINDVRDRQTRSEGSGAGSKNLWVIIVAAAMILIAILNYMKP